ncbi:MAG: SH3 domain-containing protein [Opitutaceae bacterium]|nr:SH3 domain-containing protein [Opitutaceae bacterium]MBP9911778.1 SH3 domain-containing protein [Opitutaceae bacterium]
MKSLPLLRAGLILLGVLLGSHAALATLAVGGTAYTKRIETVVRAEPRALAAAAGKLGYARKLKVLETRDGWLRVSDGAVTGWVFAGNLSDTKPAEGKGTDGLGFSASQTTATAAARPLAPAAVDYAESRNLGEARADLDWLTAQSFRVTNEEVEAYLQAQKKGEYQ